MRAKREKGYWLKKTERHLSSAAARARAAALRLHEHVAHVTVRAVEDGHEVSYSVAKWYLEQAEQVGIKL